MIYMKIVLHCNNELFDDDSIEVVSKRNINRESNFS